MRGVLADMLHAQSHPLSRQLALGTQFGRNILEEQPAQANPPQLPARRPPPDIVLLSPTLGQVECDLGRLASDLLLFYTREFGFVELPDAFTTGSSIMPQKRNPDVFELVRGRTATAQASLVEVLAITAKLPSGYQRDLQLIKAPLFRSIDVCLESLDIMAAAIPQVRFRPDRIRLDADIHAAAEANALVAREGIPFREAYRRVGARLKSDPGSG